MLEELQKKLLEMINSGTDFLSEQIPDVLHQLLLWYGVYNFILFIVGITVMFGMPYLMYKLIKKYGGVGDVHEIKDRWGDTRKVHKNTLTHDYDGELASWNSLHIVTIFFYLLILGVSMNLVWLQIWIAPKVWLIEYVNGLVK